MTLDARDFPGLEASQDERLRSFAASAPDDEPTVVRVGRGASTSVRVDDDEVTVLRIAGPARRPARHS